MENEALLALFNQLREDVNGMKIKLLVITIVCVLSLAINVYFMYQFYELMKFLDVMKQGGGLPF